MKLPSDLLDLAIECKIAHLSASKAEQKEKLKHLTDRNFLRSKMIWLYGLTMTRTALTQVKAVHLIDKAAQTDLTASAKCCMDYEQKAIKAARRKNEDVAKEAIESRDFLMTKMAWQHGAIQLCTIFEEIPST